MDELEKQLALDLTYRAKVKNFDMLRQKNIVIGISIGGEVEGDKFAAMLELAYKHADNVIVIVADVGKRFNIEATNSEIEADQTGVRFKNKDGKAFTENSADTDPDSPAQRKAHDAGSKWIGKHDGIFEKGLPYLSGGILNYQNIPTPKRWYELRKDPDYAPLLDEFKKLYARNKAFREKVEESIDFYLDRPKSLAVSMREARILSRKFILEEAAIMVVQARLYGGCVFYRGTELPLFTWMRQETPEGVPRGMELQGFANISFEPRAGKLHDRKFRLRGSPYYPGLVPAPAIDDLHKELVEKLESMPVKPSRAELKRQARRDAKAVAKPA